MEAKFRPLERRIENDGITRDESFQKNSRVHPFGHERNEEIFEGLKVEPVEEKLSRYKSNWLRHATTINNKLCQKVMLNYKINGRKILGRPLKRLVVDDETCLSKPNS
jgi:hypothetical protein